MQEQTRAQAYPRKRFFVEMFTRDISLIDCVSTPTDFVHFSPIWFVHFSPV